MRVGSKMLAAARRIPLLIAILFAADCTLALIPVLDFVIGRPFQRLSNLFNLGNEGTVPTWYSSMQWFCAGVMLVLFATHALRTRMRGSLFISALALGCIVFSIDEIAQIHERLGSVANAFLVDQRASGVWATGLWPFVVGIPAIVVIAITVRGTRTIFLARTPRALVLLIVGLAIMLTGAVFVELSVNLLPPSGPRGGEFLAQVVAEELMEMLGATFVVWSAASLLHAYGFRLRMPIAAPQRRTHLTAHPAAASYAAVRSAGS
jgi:hypothetical protein